MSDFATGRIGVLQYRERLCELLAVDSQPHSVNVPGGLKIEMREPPGADRPSGPTVRCEAYSRCGEQTDGVVWFIAQIPVDPVHTGVVRCPSSSGPATCPHHRGYRSLASVFGRRSEPVVERRSILGGSLRWWGHRKEWTAA